MVNLPVEYCHLVNTHAVFWAGKTGEDLGLLVLHDKLMKALAADFLYIQVRCRFLTYTFY
jgi:salicylate hydroxylase